MANTKAQRRIADAKCKAWKAIHYAEASRSKLELYQPMTFHRLLVQALFPAWHEAVKELLARLSCARNVYSLLSDTEYEPRMREQFENLRQEFTESGMLEILDRLETEIIFKEFLQFEKSVRRKKGCQ